MNCKKKCIIFALSLIFAISTLYNKKQVTAYTKETDLPVYYVNSVDNTQYPVTDKFVPIYNLCGSGEFRIKKPTIIKAYMSWDQSCYDNVKIWFSRDEAGIDLIGEIKNLKTLTNYSQYLLDPGNYYLNYELSLKDEKRPISTCGICLLGQEVNSTEDYYASSMNNPNVITLGEVETGFLSASAPIDYYRFSIRKKSIVTIDYLFSELKDVSLSNAEIRLMNSSKAIITSAMYNTRDSKQNVIKENLNIGTYYISMSGAQTITSLKVTAIEFDESTSANQSRTPKSMSVNYVNYIDNALYPKTSKFKSFSGVVGSGKFKINQPTIVKSYMNWDSSYVGANLWYSRDKDGLDMIGEATSVTSKDSYLQYFLDPGTYYINYELKSSGYNNDTVVSKSGICILGQKVKTTEDYLVSSFSKSNKMTNGKNEIGFLSITAPIDYYKFTIKTKSMVTIQFDFHLYEHVSVSEGRCKLMNRDRMMIYQQTYNTSGVEYNTFSKLLDPGTYYISMSGAQTTTSLKYKAISYKVTSTVTKVGDKYKVKLNIPYIVDVLMVRKGSISLSKLRDSSVWNSYDSNCRLLQGKSCYVDKPGYYTFLIRDTYGNYDYYKINITDTKKPVENGKTSKKTK